MSSSSRCSGRELRLTNRRRCIVGIASALLAAGAWPQALPPELTAELPQAKLRGSATLRWFGLHIYDGRLWSETPVAGDGAAQPLALELVYARHLTGAKIAQRSIDEMKHIGRFSDEQGQRWLDAMTKAFPDVKAGDRITGIQQPGQSTRFFFNGRPNGELADADFTRLFFGIWLSPKTSEPEFRRRLIGAG